MKRGVLLILVLFYLPLALGLEDITIISPKPAAGTIETTQLFSWHGYPADYYHLQIARNPGFTELAWFNISTAYYTYNNLGTGTWYWKVSAIDNGSIVAETVVNNLTIHAPPGDFSVTADLSDWEDSEFVRLHISAPLHAEVYLVVDGPDNPITYHPMDITELDWYTKIEDPGLYTIYANISYFGYTTEYNGHFEVNETEEPDIEEENESDNRSYLYIQVMEKEENLTDVLLDYESPTEDDLVRINNGSIALNLSHGQYTLIFTKDDYVDETLTLTLNADKKITVHMNRNLTVEPVVEKEQEPVAMGITITAPENRSSLTPGVVAIQYTTGKGVTCSLFINDWDNQGWEVLGEGDRSRYAMKKSANTFLLEQISSGRYKIMVRCDNRDGDYGYSDVIYFSIADDRFVRDVIDPVRQDIKRASNEILQLQPSFVGEILKSNGEIGRLDRLTAELEGLSEAHANLITSGALTGKQIEERQKEIDEKIENVRKNIPEQVSVESEHQVIMYLPVDDFTTVLEDYFAYTNFSSSEKTYLHHALQELNRNYMVTMTVWHARIANRNGSDSVYTIVRKEVSSMNASADLNDITLIEYFPEPYSIYSRTTKLNEMLISANPDEPLLFYIKELKTPDEVKKTQTLVVMESDSSSASLLTGMSVGRGLGIGSSIFSYLVVILAVGVLGVFFIPSSPYAFGFLRSTPMLRMTRLLNKALEDISKGKTVFDSYPSILEHYDKLMPTEQEEVQPILKSLSIYLTKTSIDRYLSNLQSKINFQEQLSMFDSELYNASLAIYNQVLKDHSELPDEHKYEMQQRINDAAGKLSAIAKRA